MDWIVRETALSSAVMGICAINVSLPGAKLHPPGNLSSCNCTQPHIQVLPPSRENRIAHQFQNKSELQRRIPQRLFKPVLGPVSRILPLVHICLVVKCSL